jgi:hypothetical protein
MRLLILALCLFVFSPRVAVAQDGAQAPAIQYLDMTTRADGWAAAQLAATAASRNKGVVVVSYLDPQITRALFDEAVRFMRQSAQPRVVGIIRSPAAPAHITATPNPLQFDVFFDGSVIPPMEHPDPRFTRPDQLNAVLRGIQRNYFATNG